MKKLISAALSVLMLTALTVAASADIAPMPREVQQIRWVLPVLAVAVVLIAAAVIVKIIKKKK